MYTIEEFDKYKIKVLKYILYKKRTENEVRNKFKKEIEENLLEDIIVYLKNANYINDKDFIKKSVEEFLALKNLSIKEIEFKLYTKGIDKNYIDDYIYNNEQILNKYEIKSARNIINKKISTVELEKIKHYLLNKRYKLENINKAFEVNKNQE